MNSVSFMPKSKKKEKRLKIVLYYPRAYSATRPAISTPLPLLAISKFLWKDHDIVIISEILHKKPLNELLKHCKDAFCLGISAMTGYQIKDSLMVSKLIKEKYPELPIIWGGWHASLDPVNTIESPYVDIIVRGQGERTFFELINAMRDSKPLDNIRGLSFKKNGKIIHNPARISEDINNFPSTPYHLIDVEKCLYSTEYGNRTINYISSYGCPFGCKFCADEAVNKRKWTGLTAKKMVDEIEVFIKNYDIDSVAIHDSNFFVDPKRVKEFCKEILKRKLNIKWGNVNGRTRQLLDLGDETWDLLEKSGCSMILVGAESGYQEALDYIDKKIRVEDTLELAELCHRRNIKVLFSMLLGLPWEKKTEEQVKKEFYYTFKLIDQVLSVDRRFRILLSMYTPYPGSQMYHQSLKMGLEVPDSLEGWSNFQLDEHNTPWTSKRQSELVKRLTRYIFFFMDKDSYSWISVRINNRFARELFRLSFKLFESIAVFRWKYKFFHFPFDYEIYSIGRDRFKLA